MKFILASFLLAGFLVQTDFSFGQQSNTSSASIPTQISADATGNLNASTEMELETFQVEGVVIERRKYSFVVKQDDQEFEVKVAPDTAIGLRMTKPWFNWEKGLVVVDSAEVAGDSKPDSTTVTKTNVRKAVKLPAEKLFLISRFLEQEQLDFFLETDDKRLNFYLVTPFDPGEHMPTKAKPYISGALSVEADQSVRLNVEGKAIQVRLGFHDATMNGFTISQLVPEKTRVLLSGVGSMSARQITARSIVFEPIHQRSSTVVESPLSTKK